MELIITGEHYICIDAVNKVCFVQFTFGILNATSYKLLNVIQPTEDVTQLEQEWQEFVKNTNGMFHAKLMDSFLRLTTVLKKLIHEKGLKPFKKFISSNDLEQ